MKRYAWIALASLLLLSISGSQAGNRDIYSLPEDRGTAGTLAALEKLPVYARVLHITAHPDDESAGTLTWLSRKFHAQTALFCLTRGEGGQNILGSEKYDALGLVRTGELLEACRYYGTELYFGNVLDFGFSKTGEETLSKWGREETLGDLVRFIRRWRPAVILSRFQGGPADGHGHHQAAGLLTREAFRAAADPRRFPEQLKNGLQIWQPAKLYVSSFGGELSGVRVPVGDYDPVLGRSYREIASEGYSKHRSQGSGSTFSLPGRAYEYFRLLDSTARVETKELTLFDSIDTSLNAIPNLAGNEQAAITFLRQDLHTISQTALSALQSFKISSPETSAVEVARGIEILTESIHKVEGSSLSKSARQLVGDALRTKLADFQNALSAVLGISFVAVSEDSTGVPGEGEPINAHFYNRGSETLSFKSIKLQGPGNIVPVDANNLPGELPSGSARDFRFSIDISRDARITEPFWYIETGRDARYKVRPTEDEFAPFGKPEISAEAIYQFRNIDVPIQAIVKAQAGDAIRGADFVEFQLVPEISVSLDPDFSVVPDRATSSSCKFRVSVLNNKKSKVSGSLKLVTEKGWKLQPAEMEFTFSRKGEVFSGSFVVQVPPGIKAGSYTVEAVATLAGREFRRGYRVISYPENWTRNLFSRAQSRIEKFDIQIRPNLTVGYVPGAGDDVPAALERIGVKVQTLSASDLAFGDLDRFPAIISGIRAYNVNEDLKANNQRLLDYVAKGGTLIVQYVRPEGRPSPGATGPQFVYAPYPMSVSNSDRITVEDSPIKLLDPANPIFNQPNKISESDFQGWVQERGLYFMSAWDSRYKALLSGNDPGEEPKNGGMLYMKYGKGYYIYTGYSWFRQLPAGVPGAFRIFANMLSLKPAGR
jgi:LmbE family N-acetylglucosaminyl deacetylase